MDSKSGENPRTGYQVLNELYHSIKKLSKTSEAEKGSVCVSVKKELNDFMDEAIKRIDGMMVINSENKNLRLIAMKMTMFYERSKLLMSLGDEELARETLATAFNIIREISSQPELIYLAFRIINHHAYLLTKRNDFEAAKRILELGETIYNDAHGKAEVVRFFTSDDLFSPEEMAPAAPETSRKFERLYTNNLQMLCYVFDKLEPSSCKFIARQHQVLERQLEMKDEEASTWATRVAKLASSFLPCNGQARHYLCAAACVLREHEKSLDVISASYDEKLEDLKRKLADVGKCWVKYGLCLFNASRRDSVARLCSASNMERIWTTPFGNDDRNLSSMERETSHQDYAEKINSSRDPSSELAKSTNRNAEPENIPWMIPSEEKNVDLTFRSLKCIPEYENQVSAALIETTAQARSLFLFIHGWLKRVKSFYSLNEYPMEYVNTILDLSELYRFLAFYEEDIESQYTVQKLRADALETMSTVLREIRPQCYAVSIELFRELAEVQMEMMGLNLRRIYAAKESGALESDETIHKINALTDIHSRLEQFRDSFNIEIEKTNVSQNVEPKDSSQIFCT